MVGYSTFWLVDLGRGFAVTVLTNANGNSVAAHLLARATHTAIVGHLSGSVPTITLDTRVHGPLAGEGRFTGRSGVLEVQSGPGGTQVNLADSRGSLFCPPEGRTVCDHPQLRTFPLDYDPENDAWTWGPRTWRRETARPLTRNPHRSKGHYRSYSPWLPRTANLRSLRTSLPGCWRRRRSASELALVEVSEGCWRIGDDPGARAGRRRTASSRQWAAITP